jgi:uncharacterized protein (TIGR01777 family)
MKIVVAGGTGFLGRPLVRSLAASGDEVVVLTRTAPATPLSDARFVSWTPDGGTGDWASELEAAAAVVNLAGASIAARRWTRAQKDRILQSRLLATRSLVAALRGVPHAPGVFISGSAVGYYGPLGDELVTEEHAAGTDFLAGVCRQWEAEAMRAADVTRVVCVRTGLALERDGGALPRLLPLFWIGAGGPLGSGRQYWPWIHRQDWVALIRWTITNAAARGPINATAPSPVTNREFASTLGRVMRRPALLPAPAFAMRLVLGEMADALLLSGQRAIPAGAERLGFSFQFTRLEDALGVMLAR